LFLRISDALTFRTAPAWLPVCTGGTHRDRLRAQRAAFNMLTYHTSPSPTSHRPAKTPSTRMVHAPSDLGDLINRSLDHCAGLRRRRRSAHWLRCHGSGGGRRPLHKSAAAARGLESTRCVPIPWMEDYEDGSPLPGLTMTSRGNLEWLPLVRLVVSAIAMVLAGLGRPFVFLQRAWSGARVMANGTVPAPHSHSLIRISLGVA